MERDDSRALPDFIIVGAQRSGATSLFHCLSEHPGLVSSCQKEVHFFDGGLNPDIDHYELGLSWYKNHFPLLSEVKERKVFEATPLYLFNPLAAQRMFETIPGVKVVVLLRNPTDRAISNYFLERKLGREKRSIMDAMTMEEDIVSAAIQRQDYKSDVYIHNTYKSRGRYKEQLERYLSCFSPKDIFIASSEELFSNSKLVLNDLLSFLGVKGDLGNGLEKKNSIDRSVSVGREVYEYLDAYFSSYNEQLYEYLGKDFFW